MLTSCVTIAVFALLIGLAGATCAQVPDEQIAARFAPVFHQALAEHPRGDYITNFDFDGDWDGTNNWEHADDREFSLKGYIYYSVAETPTHYFIHYAVFHARDYKGGDTKGVIYSKILRDGARILSRGAEPSGMLAEAVIAHENDMEGALVVVEKRSADLAAARIVFVETLHHNMFSRYVPEGTDRPAEGHFKVDGQHVELYVEPKGHGVVPWGTQSDKPEKGWLVYAYADRADDPESVGGSRLVGYQLLPISTTLWPKARDEAGNPTFASFRDFGTVTISILSGGAAVVKKVVLGPLASAFNGRVGCANVARPPWGWVSNNHRDDPPGLWYFDPAAIVKRDFGLPDSFSTAYVKIPFWAQTPSIDSTVAAGNR
jgi:hypothetical protein